MDRFILSISMHKSKKYFCEKYGHDWFDNFSKLSFRYFDDIIPNIPSIGKSVFSMNYKFAPIYIAWYKALAQLKLSPSEIDKEIWLLNEAFMKTFPSFLLKMSGRIYVDSFRNKAARHIERQEQGKLHRYDWKINFRNIDKNCFEIDIVECAFKKLSEDFNVPQLLPGICRMDYLMANLMGNGFTRTKTLGDGDNCCNCSYSKVGYCEWSPEKGFIERK